MLACFGCSLRKLHFMLEVIFENMHSHVKFYRQITFRLINKCIFCIMSQFPDNTVSVSLNRLMKQSVASTVTKLEENVSILKGSITSVFIKADRCCSRCYVSVIVLHEYCSNCYVKRFCVLSTVASLYPV